MMNTDYDDDDNDEPLIGFSCFESLVFARWLARKEEQFF